MSDDPLRTIDELIMDGRLVFRPDLGRVDLADRAGLRIKPQHRRRPTLLRDPGYVAWRSQAQAAIAAPRCYPGAAIRRAES